MRIALDVDGIVLDFQDWWKQAAELACVELKPFLYKKDEWEMEDRYDLSQEDILKIKEILSTRSPINLEEIPGAVAGVNRLKALGHEVFFVTTSYVSCVSWEYGRRKQFKRLFGDWAYDNLCFVKNKNIIKADVFVDDKWENFKNWHEENRDRIAVHFGWHPSSQIKTWPELLNYIEGLK